jgi:transposase InsO family protein
MRTNKVTCTKKEAIQREFSVQIYLTISSRYKPELLEGGSFADTEEARIERFQYIDLYYNPVRRHSSLGHKSPMAFESDYRQRAENRAVFSSLTPKPIDKN